MRLKKCVICHRNFNSKTHSHEVEETFCNIASTFCNYLVPNSSVSYAGTTQFCCSCRVVFLKKVDERQAKMVQLSARIKQNVSNLKVLLLQSHSTFLKKPIQLSEPMILGSKLQAGQPMSAAICVGDSTGMEDTAGNATATDEAQEDQAPVLPVFPVYHITKSSREITSSPPSSNLTGLENQGRDVCAAGTAQHAIVAQGKAQDTLDPAEKQTDEAKVHQAKSSTPSQPPADCLTFQGIPYEKLPNGAGYRCCVCKNSKTKHNLPTMKYHIYHVHLGKPRRRGKKNEKSYVLEDQKTQRIRYLGKHVFHKLADGSFKCGYCDYVTKQKITAILAHFRMKHDGPTGTPLRRLVEVSPDRFEYHGLTAERRQDGSFLCGSCHFSTQSIIRLRNHLWEKLKTGIPRTCEVCGKVFKKSQNFYEHRRTHPTGEEQKCTQCGKSFETKSKLSSHIQRLHRQPARPTKPPKLYVCEFCGKEYKTKHSFDSHMNIYHNGNRKTYDCKLCDKSYASYMPLRVHMNSHTGNKVYSCDVCDMKFTQAYSVVRHKNVVHRES